MQWRSFGINNFKLRNFAVVAIECFFFATADKDSEWPEYIDGPWWSMVACGLNRWSTTVISMGMEHLSLVTLLFMYLNWLTIKNKDLDYQSVPRWSFQIPSNSNRVPHENIHAKACDCNCRCVSFQLIFRVFPTKLCRMNFQGRHGWQDSINLCWLSSITA